MTTNTGCWCEKDLVGCGAGKLTNLRVIKIGTLTYIDVGSGKIQAYRLIYSKKIYQNTHFRG